MYGTIPESLKCASALVTLVLSDNSFSGGMPELFDPSHIRYVVRGHAVTSCAVVRVRWCVCGGACAVVRVRVRETNESTCAVQDVSLNELSGPLPQRWNVSNAARTLWLSFAENKFTGMCVLNECVACVACVA